MLKRLLDYNDGEEMDIVVLIKNSQLRRNKKISSFSNAIWRWIRRDSGNFWDATNQDAATFSTGTIVELNGKREEYQGRPQIRIYSLRVVGPQEGYELDQFVKSAPEPINDMHVEINQFVDQIQNKTWKTIVQYLLKSGVDASLIIPQERVTTMQCAVDLLFILCRCLRMRRA